MRYGWIFSIYVITVLTVLLGGVHAQTGDVVVLVSDNEADQGIAMLLDENMSLEYFTTPWGEYDAGVVTAIQAAAPSRVMIIGGTAAVHSDYEEAILAFAPVERLDGEDRMGTAVEVLLRFQEEFNGAKVIIANGDDIDGISQAVNQSQEEDAFVLFVEEDQVPDDVLDAIDALNTSEVEAILSPNANETEIEDEIEEATDAEVTNVTKGDAMTRAGNAIERARGAVQAMEIELAGLVVEKGSLGVTARQARDKLTEAETALASDQFGKAYGQANAAYKHALNTLRKAKTLGKAGKTTGAIKKQLPEMIAQASVEITRLEDYLQTAGNDTAYALGLLADAKNALDGSTAAVEAGDYGTAMDRLDEARALLAQVKAHLGVDEGDFTVYQKKKDLNEKNNKKAELKAKGKGKKTAEEETEEAGLDVETAELEGEIADLLENVDETGVTEGA